MNAEQSEIQMRHGTSIHHTAQYTPPWRCTQLRFWCTPHQWSTTHYQTDPSQSLSLLLFTSGHA